MNKTYSPKPRDLTADWYLVDADNQVLGRLASQVAQLLMGKHKSSFAPHLNTGDFVVVTNASKIKVTGNKLTDKQYYHHSGYPGGIKQISLEHQLQKDPAEVIRTAVKGMLPKNRLQDDRLNRLKIYASAEHPHAAQKPQLTGVHHGR